MIKFTPELARICGELTGDGHIQLSEWRGLVSFYSKNHSVIADFKLRFEKLFGSKGHIYEDNRKGWKRYKLFFISKPVVEYLVSLSVPFGNKTNQSFCVPEWIYTGKLAFKSAYLQGLFDSEGSIYSTKAKQGFRWRIEIEMYKSVKLQNEGKFFMAQLVNMLQELGVVCSPVRFGKKNLRKEGSSSIALKFDIEQSSFRNFYKRVGFTNKLKASKLSCLCGV